MRRRLFPAEHFLELVVIRDEHVHVDVAIVVEGVVALQTVRILMRVETGTDFTLPGGG